MNGTAGTSRYEGFRIAAAIVGMAVVLLLLWKTRALVLTAFLGVLFALAVSAGVDRLAQWRIPRGLAAPLIVFSFVGILGVFGNWIGPTVREQTTELKTKLPEALGKLEAWVMSRGGGVIATIAGVGTDTTAASAAARPSSNDTITVVQREPGASEAVPGLRDRIIAQLGGVTRYFLPVITSTLHIVAGIVLVLFLAIYLAIEPGIYRRGMVALFPVRARSRVNTVLSAIATTLRRWLVTQLIAMTVIGVVTTIVLLALNVRAAIPLGILAGLLEFVPTLGPIISAIPAIAMGFVDSPEKALAVTIAYIGIQFLENHLLIPILMKEGIDLPPALTILAQAVMAIVFGVLGLLVAVPLLATVMIASRVVRAEEEAGPL